MSYLRPNVYYGSHMIDTFSCPNRAASPPKRPSVNSPGKSALAKPSRNLFFDRFAINLFGFAAQCYSKTLKLILLSFGDYRIWVGYHSKNHWICDMYRSENRKVSGARLGGEIISLSPRRVGGPLGRLNWSGRFFDLVADPCF